MPRTQLPQSQLHLALALIALDPDGLPPSTTPQNCTLFGLSAGYRIVSGAGVAVCSDRQQSGRLVHIAERRGKPGLLYRCDQHFGTGAVGRVDGHVRFTRVEVDHDALHSGKDHQGH